MVPMMNCKYLRKNTKGKALRRISWVKVFYLVRWNEYHFSAALNLLKFHQFGSTALPESLLEHVWYAGKEVWKGTLVVADIEQVDKNRRVRIPQLHNAKLNAKEVIPTKLVTIPKTADGQLKFVGGDQVLRTPTLTRYHPSSTRSSRRPSWRIRRFSTPPPTKAKKVIAHQHSLFRDQRYPHQNCFEKYLGKLVMNLFNKQTYAVYYR